METSLEYNQITREILRGTGQNSGLSYKPLPIIVIASTKDHS